jgi:hypothetical protein
MRLNTNETVRVELTPEGLRVLRSYEHAGSLLHQEKGPCYAPYFTFQLWIMMKIFGEHIYNGGPELFVDNVIIIGDTL